MCFSLGVPVIGVFVAPMQVSFPAGVAAKLAVYAYLLIDPRTDRPCRPARPSSGLAWPLELAPSGLTGDPSPHPASNKITNRTETILFNVIYGHSRRY